MADWSGKVNTEGRLTSLELDSRLRLGTSQAATLIVIHKQ